MRHFVTMRICVLVSPISELKISGENRVEYFYNFVSPFFLHHARPVDVKGFINSVLRSYFLKIL